MKTLQQNRFLLLVFLVSGWIGANAQTLESEVPGDNFSLEGALELFKKSASPEEFEKLLNSANSKVNNLDLDSNGEIDYIRVIDRNEENVHAFILQAVLSETESQDVAVIELEKLDNGKAVLQITGDADIYGIETIIEPTEEVRVNAGTSTTRAVVNVWGWPSVQYVYGPYYSAWISPWSWGYHPIWWRPWSPVAFYVYDPWWRPFRPYYSMCYSHRIGYLPHLYRPYRSTSVIVYNNYHHQIDRYRSRNDGRNRNDGYSRSRGDYHGGNNHDSGRRYEANANTSRSRFRSSNEMNAGRSSSIRERSYERSNSDFRSSPDRTQRSPGFQQRSAPVERRSLNHIPQQRQSNSGFNPSSRQQRSSAPHSLGRSSGRSSVPSGGRSGNGNSGGSSRNHQRGRH